MNMIVLFKMLLFINKIVVHNYVLHNTVVHKIAVPNKTYPCKIVKQFKKMIFLEFALYNVSFPTKDFSYSNQVCLCFDIFFLENIVSSEINDFSVQSLQIICCLDTIMFLMFEVCFLKGTLSRDFLTHNFHHTLLLLIPLEVSQKNNNFLKVLLGSKSQKCENMKKKPLKLYEIQIRPSLNDCLTFKIMAWVYSFDKMTPWCMYAS